MDEKIIVCDLELLMKKQGINIKSLHEKTGLSRTTISNLIHHHANGFQFETLEKICGVLDCSINDLLRLVNKNKDKEGGK